MSFIADKQTLDDLNMLGKYKPGSVFSIFNQLQTAGGEKLLEQLFLRPLADADKINARSATIAFFGHQELVFPFSKAQVSLAEDYLGQDSPGSMLVTGFEILKKRTQGILVNDEGYDHLLSGIWATIQVLKDLRRFTECLKLPEADHPYLETLVFLKQIMHDPRLSSLLEDAIPVGISVMMMIIKYDHLLRTVLHREMNEVLAIIHYLDIYIAASNVAKSRGFCYAAALPKEAHQLHITQMRHPALEKAVGNSADLAQKSNMIFLTGANMAGKSTCMKTFGISIYLAHMGFPVPAAAMTFSVMDGIYSSVNVTDNLDLSLSHFYAEVLRVKKVAKEVSVGKSLIVIFDELFKGTNVKDAYDATLSVTAAFSNYGNCFFMISTHIIEVAAALPQSGHIQFLYLPTVMKGNIPHYTYQLQKGITADRQGMLIIENEGILQILSENMKL